MLAMADTLKNRLSQASVIPVIKCQIKISGSVSYYAVSGSKPLFGYVPAISTITPVGYQLDPLTRGVTINEMNVEFLDTGPNSWIRRMISTRRVKNKDVYLWLGTADTPEADYIRIWAGTIADIEPDNGVINLVCTTPESITGGTIFGAFSNLHPVTALKEILELSGVPSSRLDADSFDPTDSRYEDVQHWIVRHNGTKWLYDEEFTLTEADAQELIDDLCELIQGSLITREDGTIEFKLFDPTAAAVRTLTADDYQDIDQRGTMENLINDVAVKFETHPVALREAEGKPRVRFVFDSNPTTDSGVVFTLHNTTLTGRTSSPGAGEFEIGADLEETLDNITSAISDADDEMEAEKIDDTTIEVTAETDSESVYGWTVVETTDTDTCYHIESYHTVHQYDGDTYTHTIGGPAGSVTRFYGGVGSDLIERLYTDEDSTSKSNYAWSDGSSGVYNHTKETSWIDGAGPLYEDIAIGASSFKVGTVANSTSFDKISSYNHGMCGTGNVSINRGVNPHRATQGSEDYELGTSKKGYFKINDEIIECNASDINGIIGSTYSYGIDANIDDPYNGDDTKKLRSVYIRYDVATRGYGSTSAAAHDEFDTVIDLTLAKHHADTVLARFANAAPTIDLLVSFAHSDLQIGDLVNLVSDKYINYNADGLASGNTTKWEIIGKNFDVFASPPGVFLTLSRAA